ncbi:MAG: 50S ribosomal protein L3 [Deltaproteobacteria bacterium]
MIKGLFGKKIGMTRIFAEDGRAVPVTAIQAGTCYVVQIKTVTSDGYDAVQLGIGEKKDKRANKASKGHFTKAGTPALSCLGEFEREGKDEYKPGQAINVSEIFKIGDHIDVSGRTIGKGFQGSMKRHHFSGGAGSHGSMHNRAPGSIGSSSDPSRVYKGMRMAGRMGFDIKTVQNLRIVDMRPEENIVLVSGAVPGPVNGFIKIKKSVKKSKP